VPGTDDPTVRGPYGYGSIPPQPAPTQSRPDLSARVAAAPRSRGWPIVFVGLCAFAGSMVAFVVITILSRPESSLPTTSILGTTLVPPPQVTVEGPGSPAAPTPAGDIAPLRIEHDRPHRSSSAAAPKVRRRVVREQNW
jgi:hypothetical protein